MESIQVRTADGITLSGVRYATPGELAFVVCHGFTVSTRKPTVRHLLTRLSRFGGVVAPDLRGHGRSGGRCTVGDLEVLDVDAAVAYARSLGYARVVTVGFSMGGGVVVRHAAGAATAAGRLPVEKVDAVVSVSAPSRWYIKDTTPMRRISWLLESRYGRAVAASVLRTRIGTWTADPESPMQVAGRIAVPFLVVHGGRDAFLGLEHARALVFAAGEGAEYWELPEFGHAEGAMTPELLDRIAGWAVAAQADTMRP